MAGLEADEEYQLRSVDSYDTSNNPDTISSSSFKKSYTAGADGIITISTDNRAANDYFVRGPGVTENRDNAFELVAQEVSAEFEADSVDNN